MEDSGNSENIKIVLMIIEKPSLVQSITKTISQGNSSSKKGLSRVLHSVHKKTGTFSG